MSRGRSVFFAAGFAVSFFFPIFAVELKRTKEYETIDSSKGGGQDRGRRGNPATAFEGLIGYLYLTKQEQRLKEILAISVKKLDEMA